MIDDRMTGPIVGPLANLPAPGRRRNRKAASGADFRRPGPGNRRNVPVKPGPEKTPPALAKHGRLWQGSAALRRAFTPVPASWHAAVAQW